MVFSLIGYEIDLLTPTGFMSKSEKVESPLDSPPAKSGKSSIISVTLPSIDWFVWPDNDV